MATSILNVPKCATLSNLNTAVPSCFLDVKKLVLAILTKPDWTIPAASMTSLTVLKAYLQAQALAGNIFPIPNLVLNSDNSEDITKATDAYGNMEVAKDGSYSWNFFVKKGGACYNAILRSFNGGNWRVMFVDSDMTLLGTKHNTTDMKGASCIAYTPKFKIANGSDPTRYTIDFTLPNPEEINDANRLAYIAGADDGGVSIDYTTEVVGNIDVHIGLVTSADDALTITAKTMCGNVNLYDTYDDELAVAGAWALTVAATGAAITPTGVTKDATNKAWVIAHTSSDAAKVTSTGAVAWAALLVGGSGTAGYEADALYVTLVHTP